MNRKKLFFLALTVFLMRFALLAYADTNAALMKNDESLQLREQRKWGEIKEGLQLSIQFETNLFKTGEPITASVVLKNTSTNSIILSRLGELPVEFDILNENKQKLGIAHPPIRFSGTSSFRLEPEKLVEYGVDLNRYFTFTNSGTYLYQQKDQ